MRLDELVPRLDAYFSTREVRDDDWSAIVASAYPEPYWREFAEPEYEGRWNGLMVRGAPEPGRVATCVFPSDRIVAALEPATFLFTEHPLDFADEPGFIGLASETFETMWARGISLYNVHAPLDHHPDVSPSRLIAGALGLADVEEYLPIASGIPGGAAILGASQLDLDAVAERLAAFLGAEVPVQILHRPRAAAGRVAVVAGGGADPDAIEASLERGCDTFVTGNAASRCRVPVVRELLDEFWTLVDENDVAVIDGTHYGTEKPSQVAMAEWFRALGLAAEFIPDRPR